METRIRILTADPNREFCRQLSELMAAEGDMEIIGMAADGLEALERVAELKPDLLLGVLAERANAIDYDSAIFRTALLARDDRGEIVGLMEL